MFLPPYLWPKPDFIPLHIQGLIIKSFCCFVWAKHTPLSHFTSDWANMSSHKFCHWGTFIPFWGSRFISSHTSMQWQQETHKCIYFLGRTWNAGWEVNTACHPVHISLTVCTQMKKLGQRTNICVLREHSRQ